jgi:hypothetical protein
MQTYEIRCGGRSLSRVKSHTPRHAISDYLRSLGCRDDEIEPVGKDEVAWRGARYTAVVVNEPSSGQADEPLQ